MAVLSAPVRAPNHLPRMSRQSRLSANDKGDSEIIPWTAHRSLVSNLRSRKTWKTSGRRPSIKAVRPVIASNGVPYLQMRSVGSHSTSGRKKEGNDLDSVN